MPEVRVAEDGPTEPKETGSSPAADLGTFCQLVDERLDWIFAAMLGGAWIAEIAVAWSLAGAFNNRIQTLVYLSALLICVPVTMVIIRPGSQWNQIVIGVVWSSLSLLGGWAAAASGPPGSSLQSWGALVPIAFLAFYPSPRALASAGSVYLIADLARALGWIHAPAALGPEFWLGHAEWGFVMAGGLALLGRSRKQWLLELLERQLRRVSPTADRLTGLPLRAQGVEFLRRCLGPWNSTAGDGGQIVGAIVIDIDRLKQINDTLGATAGDAVLRQTARRLSACLRSTDLLVRAGKDEFLVLLPDLGDAVQAESLAHRLIECLQTPFLHRGGTVFATASFGLALSPPHGNDPESLIHSAEQAVREAKRCGRGNYRVFEPEFMPAPSYRQGLEIDLHQALERHEFLLHYQPQVDESGRVVCVEALLRWLHPRHGFVPPNEFIPLAEASGLILPIGEWVLAEACRQGAEWIASGTPPMRIAVNVSTVQFARHQFLDKVACAVAVSNFDAHLLELEITESSLMLDHEAARDKIARLQSLGLTISIDDFGMGYSSLAYLQQLPVNALKVDRNFVTGLETSASALPLLAAIIMLAHSLNLDVVVEGVETDGQRAAIWSLGADKAQGYFFARPQAPAEVVKLFRSAGQRVA